MQPTQMPAQCWKDDMRAHRLLDVSKAALPMVRQCGATLVGDVRFVLVAMPRTRRGVFQCDALVHAYELFAGRGAIARACIAPGLNAKAYDWGFAVDL